MTTPYIELGRLLYSKKGIYMVVNSEFNENYFLVDVKQGEIIGEAKNLNHFRDAIGEITDIKRVQ